MSLQKLIKHHNIESMRWADQYMKVKIKLLWVELDNWLHNNVFVVSKLVDKM